MGLFEREKNEVDYFFETEIVLILSVKIHTNILFVAHTRSNLGVWTVFQPAEEFGDGILGDYHYFFPSSQHRLA